MTHPANQVDSPESMSAFCAYAREDERFLNRLHVALVMLRRQGKIDVWHDRRIEPGKDWEKAIDQEIETADIIFLLMSPDFLNSDYCFGKELQIALRRHHAAEARIIPIIVRPCEWNETYLERIQALPKDGMPITRWQDQDEAWLDVTAGIRRAVATLLVERNNGVPLARLSPSPLTIEDPDQEAEHLERRLAHLEELTRTANQAAVIDRLSGGSPLTQSVMREDPSRKACLVIAHLGSVKSVHDFIGIGLKLRNEGDYPAYDVKVMRDFGEGFEPEWEEAAIAEIPPRETRSTGFRVPPPRQDESNTWYPQQQTVRLKVTFRDGLARRDEAIFTIKMHNQQSLWSPKEDRRAAQFSTYCAHLKPLPAPDLRPRGLNENEHRSLETLVRRAATKPNVFYPTILSHACGDDMQCYASVLIKGAPTDPEDGPNFEHDRNFLPTLIRQGYIEEESRDVYAMLEPLFKAYGFEAPG